MRAWSLLLLVALLALESQLPAASGRRKGDEDTEAQWETTCPRPKTASESVSKLAAEDRSLQSGAAIPLKPPNHTPDVVLERLLRSKVPTVCAASTVGGWRGKGDKERHGGCPPDDGPCLLPVPDQCVDDSQCPSRMKCCHRSCFRQCVRMVTVKQGTCPEDRLRCLSPIQHLCHQDSDCQGQSRCCLSACGRDCRNPVRG